MERRNQIRATHAGHARHVARRVMRVHVGVFAFSRFRVLLRPGPKARKHSTAPSNPEQATTHSCHNAVRQTRSSNNVAKNKDDQITCEKWSKCSGIASCSLVPLRNIVGFGICPATPKNDKLRSTSFIVVAVCNNSTDGTNGRLEQSSDPKGKRVHIHTVWVLQPMR